MRSPPRNFLVWNRVRIWRTGRQTSNKNSQEYPLLPGLSLVPIPTSCDLWHWHLYIRDPARKNQSVLFTCWMDLCILRFLLRGNLLLRVRTLLKIWRESRRESHSSFQQWRTDFARMLLISRFESCISDITSTNHAWVRSIFLHYQARFTLYWTAFRGASNSNGPGRSQVVHKHRTSCRRGWPRGFGALNSSPHWVPGLVPTYLLPQRAK